MLPVFTKVVGMLLLPNAACDAAVMPPPTVPELNTVSWPLVV